MNGKKLFNLMDKKINLMKYSLLKKYKNIDEALYPHNKLVLLYETKDNYGHWVCVWKNNKGDIHFFDSYGEMPDDQFNFIPEFFKKHTYGTSLYPEGMPKLTQLLYDYVNKTGNKVKYNEFLFQGKNTFTCGKWVILRLLYPNLTEYEFKKFIDLLKNTYEKKLNKKINYDDMFDAKIVKLPLI